MFKHVYKTFLVTVSQTSCLKNVSETFILMFYKCFFQTCLQNVSCNHFWKVLPRHVSKTFIVHVLEMSFQTCLQNVSCSRFWKLLSRNVSKTFSLHVLEMFFQTRLQNVSCNHFWKTFCLETFQKHLLYMFWKYCTKTFHVTVP